LWVQSGAIRQILLYLTQTMSNPTSFQTILNKYRKFAFSERDKGDKFERLMQAYLVLQRKRLIFLIFLYSQFF
jgi:hypothetical protein